MATSCYFHVIRRRPKLSFSRYVEFKYEGYFKNRIFSIIYLQQLCSETELLAPNNSVLNSLKSFQLQGLLNWICTTQQNKYAQCLRHFLPIIMKVVVGVKKYVILFFQYKPETVEKERLGQVILVFTILAQKVCDAVLFQRILMNFTTFFSVVYPKKWSAFMGLI